MEPYKEQKDVQQIGLSICQLRADENNAKERSRLELLCKKVGAMYHERFELLPDIQKQLADLEKES